MEFRTWIEGRNRNQWNANNTIVVDIQPEYAKGIGFNVKDFAEFLLQMLSKGKKVLYFYNGESIGSRDTDEEIKRWLISALGYEDYHYYDGYGYDDDDDEDDGNYEDYQQIEEAFNNIYFYDKGYGFFRSWMDYGIDDGDIIKVIRAMIMQRVHDSRELPEGWIEELVDYDVANDPMYIPHLDLLQLRSFNNAFLCGGGVSECLKEVQLLMNAMNIKYRILSQFTY